MQKSSENRERGRNQSPLSDRGARLEGRQRSPFSPLTQSRGVWAPTHTQHTVRLTHTHTHIIHFCTQIHTEAHTHATHSHICTSRFLYIGFSVPQKATLEAELGLWGEHSHQKAIGGGSPTAPGVGSRRGLARAIIARNLPFWLRLFGFGLRRGRSPRFLGALRSPCLMPEHPGKAIPGKRPPSCLQCSTPIRKCCPNEWVEYQVLIN